MNLLLDTHVWLWFLTEPGRLDESHRQAISNRDNRVFVSSISVWEAAIKSGIGKLRFDDDLIERSNAAGLEFATFDVESALATISLPPIHRDPFDRALIAQGKVHRMSLLSSDSAVGAYAGQADIMFGSPTPPKD